MALHIKVKEFYRNELVELKNADLFKEERYIHTPQAASIKVEYPPNSPQKEVINFCANNYLGLSSHPAIVAAAQKGLEHAQVGVEAGRIQDGVLHPQEF